MFSLFTFTFQSCLEDKCDATRTFYQFVPVYKQVNEIRQNIEFSEARDLENPGKMYYYQDYIFVNELYEGIHIIDNRNPSNPVNIRFIGIPGNVDIAAKGNVLYADNYIDLLSLDISDPTSPSLLSRTEDVFPSISQDQELGHLVYYEQTEVTVDVECSDPNWNNGWFWGAGGGMFMEIDMAMSSSSFNNQFGAPVQMSDSFGASGAANRSGVGGSLARFTISGDFLYTVDQSQMHVFGIEDTANPSLRNTVNIGWGIETIFPHESNLFIGSQTGMFIYDITNPISPVQLSVFEHARACDPVYVDGDRAYVTLRDGTTCQNFTNQLDVLDVSTLTAPRLLRSYSMHHPIGLSVVDNTLFLCEDDEGIKVFDVTEWDQIADSLLDHVKGLTAYDVITLPWLNIALVIGQDGLYQFDISDAKDLKELSHIPVSR
ncbi:MAG: hypothetical protein GY705_27785 [Bacteroidetes bacterium]|nr:hypothetical protein [Bacteroidota bacterium]